MGWEAEARITLGGESRRVLFKIGATRQIDALPPGVPDECSGWSVGVPHVMWMIDKVQSGEASLDDIRSILVQATQPQSGCCLECDAFGYGPDDGSHEERQREHRRRWFEWWNSLTPESHPYLLNPSRSKIHTWDCRSTTPPQPPPVLSRHDEVKHIMRVAADTGYSGGHRITEDEAREWASGRRRIPRCKTCAPLLPGAHDSETSDVPSTH